MVDAVTGFVVEKMGNYIIEEASMLMGIKDEIEELKKELELIQGYLEDAEAREIEDEASKVWTKQVLDMAYDVEDVLDSYNLRVVRRSQRRGLMRLTNKVGEKVDAYKIADDIRTLKKRILNITRQPGTYAIGGGRNSSLRVRPVRQAPSVDQDDHLVGLVDDTKILLEKLLGDDEDNKTYMISILGMGGAGKTALASKLYNSGDVKRRFEYRAWTTVSQEYKIRDMLMRIIRSLGVASGEEMEKIRKFEEEELEDYLRDFLRGKIYLLVVDDIWEREAWESLKRALPENHNGSRVIITTRIGPVAEAVDQRVYLHRIRLLTFEESWNLFEQRAFQYMRCIDEDLQKIGKEMIKKCGGLPLAIVVLAGLLSRTRPNEWNNMRASFWRRLKDNSIHVSTVFDLSFKEMSHQLKLCFLYLSIFPEDYEIDADKLTHLIVAEGFIQEDDEMIMEDRAREYIEELIDRSLVQAVKRERGKVVSCRIHDLLRDLAIKKAKELNFVHIYNDQLAKHSTTCRREVVHHLMNYKYLCDRRVNRRMRSFLFFGEQSVIPRFVETNTLKLKLLRVLNLGGLLFRCNGYKHPTCGLPGVIGDLIHLRYLGIADMLLDNIPDFISNLRFLQTLDASGNIFDLTTDLRSLTSLRHLIGRFQGELLIGEAVNLQTLRSITSYCWSKLKQELLINLRELEIYDSPTLVDQRRVPLDLDSFSKLKNLRVLKLEVRTFKLSSASEEAARFQTLVELNLVRCGIKRLPKDMDLIFPSLESLTLFGLQLEEDPMPALQKLQRLEDLALKYCICWGVKMRISAQGFCRLRKLELFNVSFDELQIEEEAMPSLMELNVTTIDRGTKLMIPDRLRASRIVYGF